VKNIRRSLRLYENWRREVVLAASYNVSTEELVRCPIPDCANAWVILKSDRQRKELQENSWYHRNIAATSNKIEGRKVHCTSCNVSYCMVCQLPWASLVTGVSHSNMSCRRYSKRSGDGGGSDASSANKNLNYILGGGKSCPRCRVQIDRNGGCNHITCFCGMEWCYVCQSEWSREHYGCYERSS